MLDITNENEPSIGRKESCEGSEANSQHLKEKIVETAWNFQKVGQELDTHEKCLAFALENGLLPKYKMCYTHHTPMKLYTGSNGSNMNKWGQFACNKRSCRSKSNGKRVSRSKGTWFHDLRMPLPNIFHLMYCFANNWTYKMAMEKHNLMDSQSLSTSTVCEWYRHCREVVVLYQLEHQEFQGKIGGPGKIVEIDERQFGKRKCIKGHHIEGHWIIGCMEEGSDDLRLEIVPDNIQCDNVLVLIEKHIEKGSIIHTDCWRAYDSLGQHGYVHKRVQYNSSENVSDETNDQRIEQQWKVVKQFFRKEKYIELEYLADYIVEYIWRRNMSQANKDPFVELINAIKFVYKVK